MENAFSIPLKFNLRLKCDAFKAAFTVDILLSNEILVFNRNQWIVTNSVTL